MMVGQSLSVNVETVILDCALGYKDGKKVYRRWFNVGEEKKAAAAYKENARKFFGEYTCTECIKRE